MAHVHVSRGDIVEVYGVGKFVVRDDDNESVKFTPENLCRACEQNDVDEPDNMPFCPRCLYDAMCFRVIERIVENVGDENVPVARVLEWDEENMRRARNLGEQYIDVAASAHDWVAAMQGVEFRDEFARFVACNLPPYMRGYTSA